MSIASAIIPNNFELYSPEGESLPLAKTYSSGVAFAGEVAIGAGVALQTVTVPAGDYMIDFAMGCRGGETGVSDTVTNILMQVRANGTVINTLDWASSCDLTIGGNSYKETLSTGQVVVRLTASTDLDLYWSPGAANASTITNVLGPRGIMATECRASGTFVTV